MNYWKYDLTEQIFLSERDTILAEHGEWSMNDTVEVAKKMLKIGKRRTLIRAVEDILTDVPLLTFNIEIDIIIGQ